MAFVVYAECQVHIHVRVLIYIHCMHTCTCRVQVHVRDAQRHARRLHLVVGILDRVRVSLHRSCTCEPEDTSHHMPIAPHVC
jgi:hypothetical protein